MPTTGGGCFYVGRHPHADDRRGLLLCRSAIPCRHQPNHLPRLGRGLLLEKEESFYPVYFFGGQKETPPRGGNGLPPCRMSRFFVGRQSLADINPTTSPAWGGDSSLKRRRVLSCLFFGGPKRNAPARRQRVAALPDVPVFRRSASRDLCITPLSTQATSCLGHPPPSLVSGTRVFIRFLFHKSPACIQCRFLFPLPSFSRRGARRAGWLLIPTKMLSDLRQQAFRMITNHLIFKTKH